MKRSVRRAALVASVFVLTACGAPPAPPRSAGEHDARGRSAFAEREDEILRHLAALDRRLARRAGITPSEDDLRRITMGAMLNEDPTVAVVAGGIDPFSFDARARGLEAAKLKAASLPADDGQPSERQLLSDLVDAEYIRLDEERALPRSASSLVRALVESWQPPKTERDVAEADRWLARRLIGVRESLATSNDESTSLDVVRARELDDALDALERIAGTPGFTAATQELVRLREAIEATASKPAARAHAADWGRTARRMRAHLGLVVRPEELARDLARLEADLRKRAEASLAQRELGLAIEKQMFVGGACAETVAESRVRSMAAPPEREPACHVRKLVAAAELSPLTLGVLHDHVVVAEWALDVARGAATIAGTEGKHRLLVTATPEARARYERTALARPVAALGAGLTVKILMAGDPRRRAASWSALGDVPLDVATTELGPR